MAGLTIVYETIETEAPKVAAMLENRCLHPAVLDDPEKTGPCRGRSHEVRIAVPEMERDMAVHILEQMEQQERLRALPVTKRPDAVFFLIVVVPVIVAITVALDIDRRYLIGPALLLAALMSVSVIRPAWGEEPDASSRNKPDRE